MVDLVDHVIAMKTEVLVKEKPAAKAAIPSPSFPLGPRLREVVKVIFRTMHGFHSASRQELRKAARKEGYSEGELKAALNYLAEIPISWVTSPPMVPGSASISNLQSFDPYAVGKEVVEELKKAEGGSWIGRDLQKLFALTSATLHRRRKEHRILYWRDGRHEFHYPKWQFTGSGALLPGVQEVLKVFRSRDEWRLMRYFLGPRRQFSNRRPLDLLREGRVSTLLKHAQRHAEENTW